jgi:hypothetical protein
MNEHQLEERVARLERLLLQKPASMRRRTKFSPWLIWGLTVASTALAYRGLGLPNHPYQVTLGILTVALAYHRGWLALPTHRLEWALALPNALLVSMLFKLLIGSGTRQPFWWMMYPELRLQRSGEKWFEVVPDMKVLWQNMPLATWTIDLTFIQTFLLIVTLAGALFRFQPFVSFTAFLLILVSLPAFASFNWAWVFPAMVSAAIVLYLQMPSHKGDVFLSAT